MKTILWPATLLFLLSCSTTPETGKKVFILTSESQEAKMGARAYEAILKKEPRSTNARWNEMLQRIGTRIATAANKPDYQWEFVLLESKEKNAFCLPGGKVAVYTGILPTAENEAGLATILGHEVAHATARHAGQRITMMMGSELGMAAIEAFVLGKELSPNTHKLIMGALGVGVMVGGVLPFSRSNESEADEIGLIYSARAGYDPEEGPKLWERMEKDAGSGGGFLSDHPSSESRRDALKAELKKVAPIYEKSPRYGVGENLR